MWATYKKNISARTVALNAEKLGLKISDGRNYFFQPNVSMPHDFVRIGYCSLNETEITHAIDISNQALAPFAAK